MTFNIVDIDFVQKQKMFLSKSTDLLRTSMILLIIEVSTVRYIYLVNICTISYTINKKKGFETAELFQGEAQNKTSYQLAQNVAKKIAKCRFRINKKFSSHSNHAF